MGGVCGLLCTVLDGIGLLFWTLFLGRATAARMKEARVVAGGALACAAAAALLFPSFTGWLPRLGLLLAGALIGAILGRILFGIVATARAPD